MTARSHVSTARVGSPNDREPERLLGAPPFFDQEDSSPTIVGVAITCILLLLARAGVAIETESVIVNDLFARAYRLRRMNEYGAVVVLDALAIGCAGVIDPSSSVPARSAIDDGSIAEAKEERVVRVLGIANRLRRGLLFSEPPPHVFDDPGALANGLRGKDAAPINFGVSNTVRSSSCQESLLATGRVGRSGDATAREVGSRCLAK